MKRIFYFSILSAFLFSTNNSSAQLIKCGSDEVRRELIAADPAYAKTLKDMDAGIQEYISTHPPTSTSFTNGTLSTLYYIPCVVHVIYDAEPGTGSVAIGSRYNPTSLDITTAIDYINKVYDGTWSGAQGSMLSGDMQIKFVLATKDPSGAATTGIERISGASVAGYTASGMFRSTIGATEISVKNLARWDPQRYYNIWTVNKIDGCDGVFCGCSCDAGYVAGFAYFPPGLNASAATTNKDGIVMVAATLVADNKVLPHELGHMLNLYHPFEGDGEPGTNTCPTNTSPTTQGDLCADTDPIINPAVAPSSPLFGCRSGTNSCTGTAYTDNTEKNFMNYTNCYRLFTNDQKARMQASLATTQRVSLASSWANNQGSYPATFAAPVAAAVTPSSSLVSAGSLCGILYMTLNGRTIYSLNTAQDGGYLNNSGKWYDAAQLNPSTPYSLVLAVLDNGNISQVGAWLDYDNNGSFNNSNEQLYLNNNIAGSGTGAYLLTINFTTPATWGGANNFVRLRVAADLAAGYPSGVSLSNTSPTNAYGQAEDYAAFLTGGVVPVSLLSFTGKQNKEAISLNWNTAQEVNTESYDIERSIKAAAFEKIGNVHATGSATGAEYTFRDADIAKAGDYLYRLKIKDHDGSFTYSNILKFTVEGRKQLIVEGNPFTDRINILVPYSNGTGSFRLLDATGRLVYSNTVAINGSPSVSLKLQNNLPAGVYILEAVINGEKFTEKLYRK